MSVNPKHGTVLRHPQMSHPELVKLLIERIPAEQKAWYLVTRVTGTCFDDFDRAAVTTLVTDWTHGRVFCATSEIRWQRKLGVEHSGVLMLCEDPGLRLEGFQAIGEGWQVAAPGEHARLKAWGSPPDPSIPSLRMETRLPQRLRYPTNCKEGRLSCLYYRAPSGEVHFLRLTGVQ